MRKITEWGKIRLNFQYWSRWSDDKIFGSKLSGKIPQTKNPNKDSNVITIEEIEKIYNETYSIVEELNDLIESIPELKENRNLLNKLKFKEKE